MTHRNRIVFMGNQEKTAFCRELARRLDPIVTRVSWIVVNAAQREALLQDYAPEDVLYLPLSTSETRAPYAVKINDLLFRDRRLMHMLDRGHAYLRAIQAPIVDFLDTDLPTLVVGELTYAYEVLAYRLVQQELPQAHWGSPFLTRVPPGHFAFFSDEAFSREVWTVPETGAPEADTDAEEVSDYKAMIHNHIAKQGSRSFISEKLGRFLSLDGYDAEDPTWKSNTRFDKLKKNARWWWNRRTYKSVPKVGIGAIVACRGRTVIFPLHLQPELNIDTCGRYWDNQAETILKIWRQLGPDDALFIKEHPVAIGNRGRDFYERLLAYPNLHLLNHAVPVPEVLSKVDYVFTISGTMGLEAALNGGRVLCLAPTTYDRLENVVTPTIADFRRYGTIDDLYDTLRAKKTDPWDTTRFHAYIARHAWQGDPGGDRNANPASWSALNLARVAWALQSVLARLEAGQ